MATIVSRPECAKIPYIIHLKQRSMPFATSYCCGVSPCYISPKRGIYALLKWIIIGLENGLSPVRRQAVAPFTNMV